MEFDIVMRAYLRAVDKHDWSAAKTVIDENLDDIPPEAKLWPLIWRERTIREMGGGASERMPVLRQARAAVHEMSPAGAIYHLAMDLNEVGEIDAALELMKRVEGRHETASWAFQEKRLRAARELSARIVDCRGAILSAGQDCFPSTLMSRWGFNRDLVEGPFTAASFWGDGPANAIADSFARLSDARNYKRTVTPAGYDAVTMTAYKAYFNHEVGPYWVDADLKRIIALYLHRIDAMRSALKRGRTLFVYNMGSPSRIENLLRALDGWVPGSDYRVLAIDTSIDSAFSEPCEDGRVTLATIPRPEGQYIWFNSEHYDTPAGFAFELEVAHRIEAEFRALDRG